MAYGLDGLVEVHAFGFAAGIPTDNDRVFCTSSAVNETCYFYNNTFVGRDRAQQTCEGMGGWLVAHNTGDEQLQVENYFTSE
jgi:hypothetical protein